MKPLRALLVGMFFCLLGAAAVHGQAVSQSSATSASALPCLGAIKSCNSLPNSAECLDMLFRDALKKHTTRETLQLIQRYEKDDAELRRDCHPVVHAIGRETYRIKGTIHESFSACDQTCHSGCYHGSVERFLRGEDIYAQTDKHPSAAELKQKAALACDPKLADATAFNACMVSATRCCFLTDTSWYRRWRPATHCPTIGADRPATAASSWRTSPTPVPNCAT